MRKACYVLIVVLCGVGVHRAGAAENSDLLWRVYTRGAEEKREILRQAYRHLLNLREAAEEGTPASEWTAGEDARWLLEHRIPARLAVERELREPPAGRYLEVLVHMAEALGVRSLTRRLPELLSHAATDATRNRILLALGRAGDEKSLAALEKFLEGAGRFTPEQLICTAARGLGLSRREEYLPLLRHVSRHVESPEGQVRLAVARYFCGEEKMIEPLQGVLRKRQGSANVQRTVLRFFNRVRHTDSVELLADYAMDVEDDRLGALALDALRATTTYGSPPAGPSDPDTPTGPPEATTFRAPASGKSPAEMGKSGRREKVRKVLQWWETNRKRVEESQEEAGRTTAPAAGGGEEGPPR